MALIISEPQTRKLIDMKQAVARGIKTRILSVCAPTRRMPTRLRSIMAAKAAFKRSSIWVS